VLIAGDDYPIHQTPEPLARPVTSDLNHYDRYFFNGATADGSLVFGVALGLYPNRQVIDGAFSVVVDGEQLSVHASARCPRDRATAVGPITVEIVEPLRVLRVVVDAEAHGLRADLTFTARTRPVEEPRFVHRDGDRVVFDYTRMTQWGEPQFGKILGFYARPLLQACRAACEEEAGPGRRIVVRIGELDHVVGHLVGAGLLDAGAAADAVGLRTPSLALLRVPPKRVAE